TRETSGAGASSPAARLLPTRSVSTMGTREPIPRSLGRGRRERREPRKLSLAVPVAALHRRLLIVCAIALFGGIFVGFVIFEVPGLGIGHFYYIPVAMIALAAGTWAGIGGGLLATGLYVLSIFLTPRVPTRDALTSATVIRTIT